MKLELAGGFRLVDIMMIGKGAPLGVTANRYGDRGLFLHHCDNPQVIRCRFLKVDQMAILARSVRNGSIAGNIISFDNQDEAGGKSGYLAIQYGIAYEQDCDGLKIDNNQVYRGRHAVVQSGTSSSYGISRAVSITHNVCLGQWLGAISSHQGSSGCLISQNHISGAQTGINWRAMDDTIISENIVEAEMYGVQIYNVMKMGRIAGNQLKGKYAAISITNDIPAGFAAGQLEISSNNCQGGVYCIYASIDTASVKMRFRINGNYCTGALYEGIYIRMTGTSSYWYGSVNGNTIEDCNVSATATRYAMWLTNPVYVACNDNGFCGSNTYKNLIKADGAATTGCAFMGNTLPKALYTDLVPISVTGASHKTDGFFAENLSVSSGTVAMQFTTTRMLNVITATGSGADLTTISGLQIGMVLHIMAPNGLTEPITIKEGGNIQTVGSTDVVLDTSTKVVQFACRNTTGSSAWVQAGALAAA